MATPAETQPVTLTTEPAPAEPAPADPAPTGPTPAEPAAPTEPAKSATLTVDAINACPAGVGPDAPHCAKVGISQKRQAEPEAGNKDEEKPPTKRVTLEAAKEEEGEKGEPNERTEVEPPTQQGTVVPDVLPPPLHREATFAA